MSKEEEDGLRPNDPLETRSFEVSFELTIHNRSGFVKKKFFIEAIA
jgi:hypothetical protein